MKPKTLRSNLLCLSPLSLAIAGFAMLTSSCAHQAATTEASPAWTTAQARKVDDDRIYFLASAQNKFLERAKLDAEGAALEDIANECSFVPSAVKRENESTSIDASSVHLVAAQYSVTKADCLKAQNTYSPEEIRNFASNLATQKILKHQDSTGESSDPSNGTLDPVQPGDLSGLMFARQQLALRKQAVILAGPTHYRPHSSDSKRFFQKIKADSEPLIQLGKQAEIQTMTSTWSSTHQKSSDSIPVPVLSSDSPAASTPQPTPLPTSGKRKGPKAYPKSFPKN